MAKIQFPKASKVFLPYHGVGTIVDIETKTIMSHECEVFVISFQKESMTIMIPRENVQSSGMRKLISKDMVKKIEDNILATSPKAQRGTWTNRSDKSKLVIGSGVPTYIAEMVRDGFPNLKDPNRSYTEATMYDQALSNLTSEFAEVLNMSYDDTEKRILDIMSKAQGKNEEETDDFGEDHDDFVDILEGKKEVNE